MIGKQSQNSPFIGPRTVDTRYCLKEARPETRGNQLKLRLALSRAEPPAGRVKKEPPSYNEGNVNGD
jgi:hypothetical protein